MFGDTRIPIGIRVWDTQYPGKHASLQHRHLMAKRNNENERQQLIQPKITAYRLVHLSDRREARCL